MTQRVVFLGSPEFAVPSLRALDAAPGLTIPLVITQPDRPAGRGRRLQAPPVKLAALDLGLDVYQPETPGDPEALDRLSGARPDILVVVAYGELLRRSVLEAAPHGALNVHPSLLPRYRGSSPVQAAILNGDRESGVSIIKLVRKLDAGPIVAQRTIPLDGDENAETLSKRLAELAAEMLPEVCRRWIAGEIQAVEQDESRATMTREWTRDDARIDWSQPAAHIERLVRAALPWPVAWTTFEGAPFRIHAASIVATADLDPGRVTRAGKQVLAGTGDGSLALDSVQPAGKRIMPALAWWNGLRADKAHFDM